MARFSSCGAKMAMHLALAFCITTETAYTLWAEGFRIETKVYVGEEVSPVSQATTLFLDGAVYDFLEKPNQTAVFRKSSGDRPGRFILLSNEHRIRTEFSTDQLAGAMDKLRAWSARQRDPYLRFAAEPDFQESFSPDTGELKLASHVESYTVTTTPTEHPQAVADYREFLDWYARLNTLLSAGPPPEPRLRLNAALARHQAIPLKVELTRRGDKQPLRAEHNFTWRLSREDLDRIDTVRASLASYRPVSNDEFMRLAQTGQ